MKLARSNPAITISVVIIAVVTALAFWGRGFCKSLHKERPIRHASVAGTFYPGGKASLAHAIDGYLEKADPPKVKGRLEVLVVPHAGYVYSGQVAAYGYKELESAKFDTAVIMCNSHRGRFDGIAVYPGGVWGTPLGEVDVDAGLAKALIDSNPYITANQEAFADDHTIEVQIPFLQTVMPDVKIVPVLFGNMGRGDYRVLASSLLNNMKGKRVLVIASTDLSHYPAYKDAKVADGKTIEGILSGDVNTLEQDIAATGRKGLSNLRTCACGEDGVKTAMLVAGGIGANEIVLLKAANSGDASGERGRVVGYAAIGFFAPEKKEGDMGDALLNGEEREKLLGVARKSVESYVKTRRLPKFDISDPALNEHLGAFVTLKENGRLKGCIGRFSPTDIPLYEVVSHMAVSAATEDRRFSPVKPDDLKKLHYEISVLSVPESIESWKDVRLGEHGVIVRKGLHRGVFLPQVATEYHMTKEQFLGELCAQKAGLPRDCYRDPDVELLVFTAQVFGEE